MTEQSITIFGDELTIDELHREELVVAVERGVVTPLDAANIAIKQANAFYEGGHGGGDTPQDWSHLADYFRNYRAL